MVAFTINTSLKKQQQETNPFAGLLLRMAAGAGQDGTEETDNIKKK